MNLWNPWSIPEKHHQNIEPAIRHNGRIVLKRLEIWNSLAVAIRNEAIERPKQLVTNVQLTKGYATSGNCKLTVASPAKSCCD
jgi:hypothetical protein